MKYIELLDSTGRTWVSDPDEDGELTPAAIEELTKLISKLRDVDNFHLVIGGDVHHFHPDHIVMWAIKDERSA